MVNDQVWAVITLPAPSLAPVASTVYLVRSAGGWAGVKVSTDLAGEQLWISRQLTRVGGRLLHRQTTKTDDSTASLPLFGLCVSALRHRQRVQEEARKAAGDKWKTSDLTFTTRTGPPIEPRNFNRALESHCRRAGVPRIRVHDTRHTSASLPAALDVHPRLAMCILRHSEISMTMDVYTQIPNPETRKALDRLNQSLDHPGEA
uniref:tyrosine-type recombinase/integrase n=1 Tax=Nonomuraea pusilla TaxID=46177 RepID=UPI0006E2FADC|nr:tyrosine-type recombinase/integrase [Nonomuraea pusilla]